MAEYSGHLMDLVDSHAHVDVSDFDADRDAMLARAQSAGIGMMLAIGNGPELEKLGAAVPYAEHHDWIYASVGIHPHEAKHATDAHYEELDRLARHPRVIAWGEIGLDYHYDHSPRDIQARVFRRQLGQARAAKTPVGIDFRAGRNFPLLCGHDRGSSPRHGDGFSGIVRRECNLSEGAKLARCGPADSARPFAGGDRFPVSGSPATSRKTKGARKRCGRS